MKCFIWAFLSALTFPVFISDSSISYSNSVFSVLVFAALFAVLRYAQSQFTPPRMKKCTHGLGLLFSVMTAYGYALSNLGSIPYLDVPFIASILLFAHVYAQLLSILWTFLERHEDAPAAALHDAPSPLARALSFLYARPAMLFVLLLLCWTPCYLSTFPGNFVYDASYEYYQLFDGYTRSYPLLHSVIITRLLSASDKLTGSFNPGIAVYTIAQMLLMAALFTHILRRFHADGVRPALLGALTAYYAAFPVIHLLVTCTTRDVLFSAMITWTVYLFYDLAVHPNAFMGSARRVLLLAAVLVFTLLSRNNNSGPVMLLLLLAICVLIGFVFGRKHIRHSLLFTGASLGLFYAVSALLVSLCQPLYDSPPSSSLSVLTQPIARAYMLHGDTWSEEDRAEFESYFNMETLEYVPQNADPSKGNLTVRYANMREFLAFWVKIGLRHPACYLDAVLANTQQMWFPASVLDGYTVRGMFPSYEKNYFYFGKYIEEIGSRLNLLPDVFTFYEDIGLRISFEKIPVISMLFSIGFQFWVLLHSAFYAAYKKRWHLFWPLGILLIYTIGSAFVPLVLLRYFGALFLCLPMTIVFTVCPAKKIPSSIK